MRRLLIALGVFACACTLVAQSSTASKSGHSATASSSASATPTEVKDLPVRKVVLYKNGVGFFEHAGTVTGNQRVSIDFTSSQLNDVLQSLTVLDEGGGRVGGVNYNSTTPLSEQLKSLSLGMGDNPTSTELFQALRGQRVEVTGAPGGAITGRLMSIESRDERLSGSSDSDATIQKNFLTLVASSGAARVIELTPVVSVRPLDAGLQLQLDRYLELLATTHAHGLRHLTLNAMGSGVRTLRVSYISEVPVWKSTYRIVFPRDSNDKAIVQGWAVVDNTVGADWDNVQLSLVAGAPQSFIQPLSQPLYTRRPVIPIAVAANTTPQTHEAADFAGGGTISGIVTDASGAVISGASVTVTSTSTGASLSGQSGNDGRFTIGSLEPGTYNLSVSMPGFQRYMMSSINVDEARSAVENVTLQVGASAETVMVSAAPPPEPVALASNKAMRGIGFGGGLVAGAGSGYGGGVYRPSDAISQGDVSTSAFDDYFEYALTQPVTIHKNESAMVPILQQEVPAQHVTLWSERQPHPLRAVWLTNDSKLTLDSGSFSIFENGEFAGEGLLDPIHPGERRLLSYANDQA
ncbi:MAG TPA: carboxypeptidase regulatory-like domain-containing protein, partial [Terracidiphilus sp.]|nr:carboxypeptidase regulatory-like domain-containing protein [Terracidiphilus sp.]